MGVLQLRGGKLTTMEGTLFSKGKQIVESICESREYVKIGEPSDRWFPFKPR